MKNTDSLEQLIGKFVIKFGSVESHIRICIISIPRFKYKNENPEILNLIRDVLLPNESLQTNLDVLKKTVINFVDKDFQEPWFNLINRVKEMSVFRNYLVHGNFYFEDDEIYKVKNFNHENKKLVSKEILKENIKILEQIETQLDEFSIYCTSTITEKFEYFYLINVPDKLKTSIKDSR